MSLSISVNELGARLKCGENIQLVDVRSPGEFAAGHVPRALNIPLEELESRIEDLKEGSVAVLCQSGGRASIACANIRNVRPDATLVEGGTSAWEAAGYPLVSSTRSKWSIERQVRLAAGVLVLTASILTMVGMPSWTYVAGFVGAGLTFAGLTNICGMASLFSKMPWNRPVTLTSRLSEVNR